VNLRLPPRWLINLNLSVNKAFKNSAISFIIRGNCHSLLKKTEDAILDFKKAIELEPRDSYAYCLLGHEYVFLEDLHQAKSNYMKALEIDRQQFNAYWGLGNIFLQIDDYLNALTYFYNALTINPYSPLIYSYLGIAYLNLNSNKKALENFEKAESFKDDSFMNTYYKSVAYYKMGDFKKGAINLEELLLTVKNEPKLYVLLGKIYVELGKLNDAHFCFTKAIHLDPRNSQGKIRELLELINSSTEADKKKENEVKNSLDEKVKKPKNK